MTLGILPVVEFEPSSLGVESFGALLESGRWTGHWEKVLATLGLQPLRPGSWHVSCSAFNSTSAWEALVRVHLRSPSGSIPVLDEISPINGGYAFHMNDVIQIEPGCCCDLSDLAAWRAAFKGPPESAPLAIGHGCVSLSTDGNVTTVTIESERANGGRECFEYPEPDFARALERAERAQSDFAESLAGYLRAIVPAGRVAEVVDRLVFGS